MTPPLEDLYDPRRAEVIADPYPHYRALREKAPVAYSAPLRGWMLTRYDDVRAALVDPRLSNDRITPFMDRLPEHVRIVASQLGGGLARAMNFSDPPLHTRLRALVGRAFVPSAAESLRPLVETVANELLDAVDPAGFDLIAQLASPLPVTVIGRLLGTPDDDRPRLKRWSDDIAALIGGSMGTPNKLQRAYAALLEIGPYFAGLLAERRAHPRDDLMSVWASGSHDDALTDEEIIATAILVLGAGHETTTNLIGNGMWLLLDDPRRWQRLASDRELVPSAVEEIVRYECPNQNQGRIARTDLEVGGVTIEKGALVHCMIGAANRDPAVFANPDTFDVARTDNRHLGFGHGIHFCIGASLARLEARVAFTLMLERWGTRLELQPQDLKWRDNLTFRGLESLRAHAHG